MVSEKLPMKTRSRHENSAGSANSQNLTQDELDLKPWKYIGYKGYSSFIASENDFFILRRFSSISVRIALRLQDHVTLLEERLQELDRAMSRREAVDVHNGSFRLDDEERSQVLGELKEALMNFNEFVLQQVELKKQPVPANYDIESIDNWHHNHLRNAISPPETKYLTNSHDLFSIGPKVTRSPLQRLLERSSFFRGAHLFRDKHAPHLPLYDTQLVAYSSNKRINIFIDVLTLSFGVGMLIAPMWTLEFVDGGTRKLGVITGFIVGFLGIISYSSSAKPFEVLGATAAYSAVLMVFLQLGTTTSAQAPATVP